ncbi:ARHGEF30 [Mytilus edulis]|uniref:OBSCN n=1 Tax=Mytilus edulis TaxID=6550 RepID=A0A8S3SKW3_MYTED|nr:ARHGEF30 [Mytilus edulis]
MTTMKFPVMVKNSNLKLKRPKPDDSGEYFVHVGESFRKVQLNIIGYFLKDPSNIQCYEGGEAIIKCEVRSNSPPVKWKKGNNDLAGNDNYEISSNGEEQQLKLKRPKPDDRYFLKDPSNIQCYEGGEAIFICEVRSNSPSVKWKKGNNDLAGNDNYEIFSNGEEQQLKLKRPKPEDSGEYFVHVGESFRKVQLNITGS